MVRHFSCALLLCFLATGARAVPPAIPGKPPVEPGTESKQATPAPVQHTNEQPVVAVFPLPSKEVLPTTQDRILQSLAKHLAKQYGHPVLSGRALGRAVWGTLGTGLEESSMAFTAKVQEGMQAYNVLQMGKSIEYFEEAKKYLPVCGPEIRDVAVLSDLYLFSGMAYLAQGQTEKAAEHFRQAVSIQPKLQISRKRFSPDARKAFAKARQQLLSGHPNRVRFTSDPAGAIVYLDGRRIGSSPTKGEAIYPGRHFVRFEMESHAPWTLYLTDDLPKQNVHARMIPVWKDEPPEEIMVDAMVQPVLSAPVLDTLRKLASAYGVDALVLTSFLKADQAVHMGIRVFALEPESLVRPRLFNLGTDANMYDVKVEGVVSTLSSLRHVRPAKRQAPVIVRTNQPPTKPFRPIQHVPVRPPGTGDPLLIEDAVDTPWYKTWWFWTLTGVVVAGAAVGGYFLFKPEGNWTLVVKPVGPTTP